MNPTHSPLRSASAEDFGGALTEAPPTLAQTARDATAQVRAAASETVAKAKDEAERIAREKKETAASSLGECSSAIHESARSIEARDPNIAWFTHRAAERLQGVADYLRQRDFAELRRDGEDFARRHPAVFFGGMFVAGVLVGNLFKASRRRYDARDRSLDDDEGHTPDHSSAERYAADI